MKNYENWFATTFIVCIILGLVCIYLYQQWEEEKAFRIWEQSRVASYEQDILRYEQNANYYQQLYYDCHNQKDSLPWERYADK
ncbi:MAG: hypothetical protein MUP81_04455 [Dehalococcoidia bacterium]|nr:hypothetical protein [Dehalococcoidia bacterium]